MDIVPRSDWGARYRAGFGPRALPTSEAWLHHSVTLSPDLEFRDLNADSVDDDEAAAMRTIERIGQERFGAGFSYNLAEMPSGRVYEGCGIARVGAHTKGRNTRALAVVVVGNYERDPVPEPVPGSLARLLRHLHATGAIDAPAFDGGHRDVGQTSCPGRHLYAHIPAINRLARASTPQEDDMVTDADIAKIAGKVWDHPLLKGSTAGRRLAEIDTRTAKLLSRESVERVAQETGCDPDKLAVALREELARGLAE